VLLGPRGRVRGPFRCSSPSRRGTSDSPQPVLSPASDSAALQQRVCGGIGIQDHDSALAKNIDIRFHWLQDRIQRGQFRVQHVAGDVNVADFFTKALPRSHQARPIRTVLRPGSCSSQQRAPISSSVLLIHVVCTIMYNQAGVLIP
jgi:hypothetical protein